MKNVVNFEEVAPIAIESDQPVDASYYFWRFLANTMLLIVFLIPTVFVLGTAYKLYGFFYG